MLLRLSLTVLLASLVLFLTVLPLNAMPAQVTHQDTPQCDPLFIPTLVDEIGDGAVFPIDEVLLHADLGLANPVCLPTDIPGMPDFLVSITNLTSKDFQDVWYVADAETTITNFDGEANDISFPPLQEAFRIDTLGIHKPLLFESGPVDGIWQSGEEWRFVLQDYTNSKFLAPDAITSIGVGNASVDVVGFVASSGSIITARPVPEPASLMLALLGSCGLIAVAARRRRRRTTC